MDFSDSPEEAAFRSEVVAFLKSNASGYVGPADPPWSEEELVARGRDWQRLKLAHGFGALPWPRAFGGREASSMELGIFHEEEGRYHVPYGPFIKIGLNLAGPTILHHGTEAQKAQFVAPTLKAELLWCQLFSEPSAGSDLAGLRTRAVRDGDDWLIDGQKLWTSWGHTADYGILIARHDDTLPKHKGLTFFIIDMKSPGITVRPIRQINGRSDFNEVFLDGVRVPDTMRVGGVGEGWRVAMTTLTHERAGAGGDAGEFAFDDLLRVAIGAGRLADPAVRQRLADLHVREHGVRYFRKRQLSGASQGRTPGAEAGIGKLLYGRYLQELSATAMEFLGEQGVVADASVGRIMDAYLWSSVLRVAGGADEILRNQLGERVLGLPADARSDRDTPFNAIPVGPRP